MTSTRGCETVGTSPAVEMNSRWMGASTRGGAARATRARRRWFSRAARSSRRTDLFLPPPASYRSRRDFFLDPVVTFFFQLESERFITGHHQPAVHHHVHIVGLDVIQE